MHRTYPLIIAHRGASALAPENTLAAFKKAIDDHSEGIEFDVRLTKDGVPVVFHDSDLKRICGVEEKVSALTATELMALNAGSWFNEKNRAIAHESFESEKIPTLKSTLEFLKGFKGKIYIELKAKNANVQLLAKAVCDLVKTTELGSQVIIKSFKLDAIPLVKGYLPEVSTASLFTPKVMTVLRKEKRLINISKELGADRLSLHFSLATRKLMRKAKKQRIPVTIWTVDNPRWVNRAIELRIDHIITNDPATLIARRHQILRKNSIVV